MGNKPATTTQTTQQSRSPWEPAAKPLTNVAGRAEEIGSNYDNFAPLYSDLTNQGISTLAQAGQNGSAAVSALGQVVPGSTAGFNTGLGTLQDIASGKYVNGNPYLDPVLNKTLNDTASRVNSQFTAAGRFGSGAHTGALTRELGNVENQARLSNYNTGMGNMQSAANTLYGGGFTGGQLGTTLDQSSLFPAQTQLAAGSLRDQQLNAARTAPMNAVQWESGILNPIAQQGGSSTGTTVGQTKQPTNWLTTGLGIGQMGLGLLSGNPMMMASGAGSTIGNGMSMNGGGAVPGLPWTF